LWFSLHFSAGWRLTFVETYVSAGASGDELVGDRACFERL